MGRFVQDQRTEGVLLALNDNGRRRLSTGEDELLKRARSKMIQGIYDPSKPDDGADNEDRDLVEKGDQPVVAGDDERELQSGIDEMLLTLVFDQCAFNNNTQGPHDDVLPTYGVVVALTSDNKLIFSNSIFSNNVFTEVSPTSKLCFDCTRHTLDAHPLPGPDDWVCNRFKRVGRRYSGHLLHKQQLPRLCPGSDL